MRLKLLPAALSLALLCAYVLLALARDVLPCLLVIIGLQERKIGLKRSTRKQNT